MTNIEIIEGVVLLLAFLLLVVGIFLFDSAERDVKK